MLILSILFSFYLNNKTSSSNRYAAIVAYLSAISQTISSITWFKEGSATVITVGIEDDEKTNGNRTTSLTISNVRNRFTRP